MSSARRKLCIGAPNWVGDLTMATPVLEAAVACEAFDEVVIACRERLAALLGGGPLEPHVRTHRGGRSELELYRALAPDVLLLLSNSFGAAWRAWRAGVPVRAGSALSGRRWLLTHAVVPPRASGRRVPIPTAHLHRDVAGLVGVHARGLHPRLAVTDQERASVRDDLAALGLGDGEAYVLCCPGAAFGAAKLWPPERFARALDLLHETHGWRGVVSGGPGEERLVEAVASAARRGALAFRGATRGLEGLRALVAGARLVLVGDSGPRWIAAAFDVPCVSVLGPNVPQLTASSLELCEVVRLEGLACSPCAQRTCPLGHHRCMRELAPEAVVAAAERVLARARGAAPAALPVAT